jgi:hypothetical protein
MRTAAFSPVTLLVWLLAFFCLPPASPAVAANNDGPGPPETPVGLGLFDRDDVLIGGSIIDGVTGALTAVEILSGRSSGMVNCLTLVFTAPAVAYGAAVLGHDANDPAMWVMTIAAGTIFTLAAVDVLKRHLGPGEPYKPIARNFIILPRVEPLPNERSTRVGLALAGTF